MSEYLSYTFLLLGLLPTALIAAAVVGLVAGVLGPLIVTRNMAFSVHGTSELAFTGGAAALLVGVNVGFGSLAGAVVAAIVLGLLTRRTSEHDSVIGAVLSFGLGLGVLLLSFYGGNSSNRLGLLFGQVASVDTTTLVLLVSSAAAVLVVLAVIYRPLLFASVDGEVAAARGVPIRVLSPVFAVLVGVVTALGVQTIGSLLVLSLMITPAAAACRVTASPVLATVLSVVFAEVAVLGGIALSVAPGLPVSSFVTALSFLIYLACRLIGAVRVRRLGSRRPSAVLT